VSYVCPVCDNEHCTCSEDAVFDTNTKLDQLIAEQHRTNQLLMYLACIMIGVPDAKTMVKEKLQAFTDYMEAQP
jgi:hypothetical protein